MTSTVLSASLLIHIQVPSGDAWAPCARSMPGISATTLLVAASMMWTESPALLVWMIRTRPPLAAVNGSVNTTTASAAQSKPERFDECSHRFRSPSTAALTIALLVRSRRAVLPAHPGGERLELRVVLRRELPAAVVEFVAAGRGLEGMRQQPALHRLARHDQPRHRLEVLARLLLVPGRRAGRRAAAETRPRRCRCGTPRSACTRRA